MAVKIMTDGKCPICEGAAYIPQFQVAFPRQSSLGYHGFPLGKKLDVPAWIIVQCQDCTASYPHPYPSASEIENYYLSQQDTNEWEDEYYVEVRPEVRQKWGEFADKLTRLRGNTGRLLEIGCAAGWLLKGAQEHGWDVAGLEASPKFQKYATGTLNLPVQLGIINDLKGSGDGTVNVTDGPLFDTVVMTDVIEHLHDPVEDLRTIRSVMAPDGYLVVATCDIGSFGARFYGVNWRQVVLSHTVYWTKRSMKRALERSGFRLQHMSEVRYWDPDPRKARLGRLRETSKLLARIALFTTYLPLSRRFGALQKLPGLLTRNRISHSDLEFKIGDQPILGDVMLVVARPV